MDKQIIRSHVDIGPLGGGDSSPQRSSFDRFAVRRYGETGPRELGHEPTAENMMDNTPRLPKRLRLFVPFRSPASVGAELFGVQFCQLPGRTGNCQVRQKVADTISRIPVIVLVGFEC